MTEKRPSRERLSGQVFVRTVVKNGKDELSLSPLTLDKDPLVRGEKSVRLFRLSKDDAEKLKARDSWEARVLSFTITGGKDKKGAHIIILRSRLERGWRSKNYFKEDKWYTATTEIGTGETLETSEPAWRDEVAYTDADGAVAVVEKIWAEGKLVRARVQKKLSLDEWRKERKTLWTYRGAVPEKEAVLVFEKLDFGSLTPDPIPKGVRPLREAK